MNMTLKFWLIAASLGLVSAGLYDPTDLGPGYGYGDSDGSGCGLPHYSKDKWCDDENNNAACNFDGGACCGPNVIKTYCNICQCHPGGSDSTHADHCTDDIKNGDELGVDCGGSCIPCQLGQKRDDIEGKVEAAFSGCNTDGKDGLTWMEVVHCIEKYEKIYKKHGLPVPTMTKEEFDNVANDDGILTWEVYWGIFHGLGYAGYA